MKIVKKIAQIGALTSPLWIGVQSAFAATSINLRPGGSFANLPTDADLGNMVGVALQILLIVAAVVFFIMLLVGGIRWIISGGDKNGTQAARSQITAALVGLVVVFSAWIIAALIGNIFNIDIFNISIPSL